MELRSEEEELIRWIGREVLARRSEGLCGEGDGEPKEVVESVVEQGKEAKRAVL